MSKGTTLFPSFCSPVNTSQRKTSLGEQSTMFQKLFSSLHKKGNNLNDFYALKWFPSSPGQSVKFIRTGVWNVSFSLWSLWSLGCCGGRKLLIRLFGISTPPSSTFYICNSLILTCWAAQQILITLWWASGGWQRWKADSLGALVCQNNSKVNALSTSNWYRYLVCTIKGLYERNRTGIVSCCIFHPLDQTHRQPFTATVESRFKFTLLQL